MTDETTARPRGSEVDRIVASIDWEPTCLSGRERHAIVEQVLRLRALAGAPTADVAEAARRLREMDPAQLGGIIGAFGYRTPDDIRTVLGHALNWIPAAAPEGVDAADERPTDEEFDQLRAAIAEGRRPYPSDDEPDGMDLEAQGEMADQLAAAQAAIQRVRAECDDSMRIGGHAWVRVDRIERALDGDTTEEA